MSTSKERLYDLALIEEMAQGDQDFMREMAETFLLSVPPVISLMLEHCSNGEWVLMANEAHGLKSNIDMLQINSIKDEIRIVELNGKQGTNLEETPKLVIKVISVLQTVMQQLKEQYKL